MKKTLRIIVFLSALFVATGHTWAALTESDTQNLFVEPATGGTVNLYGNPDCTGDPVTYAAPGATVYIKAAPDIVHGYPTADMIEAEKTIDTGGAQARGSRRTNGITIANQLTVTEGSAPGIFSFTMPDDEAVSVSITVAFPRAPLSYINAAGQTVDTGNETVTILTGSETRLNAGWYVADATLNYSQTIWLKGDVTIILKDGAVMNIGTAQSPVSGNGISGNNYSFSIYAQSTGDDKGKLYVNATVDAIYTKNVTISGGQVTASGGSFGILTENNVTISGGQVEANGSTLGIYASDNVTLGWTSLTDFIQANSYYSENGSVGIAEGKAFAVYNGETIVSYLLSGTLTSQQVSAIGGKTLRPVDNIPVVAPQNLTIINVTVSGATLTWEPGNVETQWQVAYSTDGGSTWSEAETVTETTYTLTGLTAGTSVTVRVRAYYNDNLCSDFATSTFSTLPPVSYLDADGTPQQCTDYTILTGSETRLVAGWYVADGTINFDHQLNASGDVHLILKDNAVMNVGTEESPISGDGISGYNSSFNIYAQSTGGSKGQLYVNATGGAIYTKNVTISGGQVTASGGNFGIYTSAGNVTISGGQVTASGGSYYGIYTSAGNVTISGGQVTANGGSNGIAASGNVTLGWTSLTDFIQANSYDVYGTVSIAEGKAFAVYNGTTLTSYLPSGTLNDEQVEALSGKTLRPYNGPRNLTVTDITSTSATLTWEAGHGETQWTVSHSIDNGASWTEPATVTTTPTYSLTGLTADATVVVKVQPIKANGEADGEPATVSFTTLMCEPENQCAISYDLVDSYGDGWNGASIAVVRVADGKEVASLTVPGGSSTLSGELPLCPGEYNFIWNCGNYDSECSFTLTGPDRYLIADHSRAPSAGQFAQYTLNCDAPKIPQNLTVSNLNETGATLTWEPGDLETQWQVAYSTDGGTTWSEAETVTEPTYTLTGLTTGTSVTVRVRAYYDDSLYSKYVTCTFTPNSPVSYLDAEGNTQQRADYTILTGSETTLAAGWYVADGTLNYSQQITLNGDVHLILKDGAVMNVGTAQSPISGDGIYGYGHSLSIYAQSTGGDKGQLNVDATNYAIYVSNGDINICGGKVTVKGRNGQGIAKGTGTLNIVAGEVTATGSDTGIHAGGGSVNISGGKVTANGSSNGIFSSIDITISGGEVTATGNNGIEGGGSTLNISGGKVTAIGNANGIYISGDDITISGGQVEARGSNYGIYDSGNDITISAGKVTATGIYSPGIYASGSGNVVISGGKVEATGAGGVPGIAANNITLSWTNADDYIYTNSYSGTVNIVPGKTFFDEDGNTYSGSIAYENGAYAIDGKTLMGVDVLEDAAANDIAAIGGKHTNIMLNGRTLWKDGAWNTLCLPFSMTAEQVTAQLAPAGLMTLSTSSFADGTLSLTFEDATTIEAGRPYIIRWSKPDGYTADGGFDITNPVFQGVTVPYGYSSDEDITEALAKASRQTDYVDFIGTFSPTVIYESDAEKHNLYLGSDNKLYYPTVTDYQVKACRAYFVLNGLTVGEHANNGVRSFVLNFGDEATGVTTPLSPARGAGGEAWYSIDGVRLDAQPTRKGLYIHGGRKVVIP